MKARDLFAAGLGIAALSATCVAAQNIVIKSGDLSVALDPDFPRVIGYRLPAGELNGNPSNARVVELNGKPATCRITSGRKYENAAVYQLSFPDLNLSLDLSVTAMPSGIVMETGNLIERAATRLQTLAFPDNLLLSISTTQADAAIATCLATNMDDQFTVNFRERISPLNALNAGDYDIVRLRFDDPFIIAEAICADDGSWQKLAELPRDKFPGMPSIIRLGKTHSVESLDDHSEIGAIGTTRYTQLKILGIGARPARMNQ